MRNCWGRVVAVLLTGVALMLGAPGVPSGEVISNQWTTFITFPVNGCNGETVFVLNGEAHVLQIAQGDGSFRVITNGHFTQVGSLGNRYQMNWQERFISRQASFLISSRQLIVSAGGAPNQLGTFTFGTNDPPTFVLDCRG